jgi:hypothetical protein
VKTTFPVVRIFVPLREIFLRLFCVFCAFSRLLGFLAPHLRKSVFICGWSLFRVNSRSFAVRAGRLLWIVASLTGLIFLPRAVADSTFPTAKVASVLEGGRFKNLSTIKDVPTDVLRLCFPNHLPADPGKPWNQTDAVQDATLPFSRVQWLATDGTDWILFWEHGGIAYTTGFMMIAKVGSAPPVVVWDAGPAKKQLETFHEFQEYIRSKGLFSGPSAFRP